MERRVSFVVHGKVQNVGFRYFTRAQARECGVTGWCRNTIQDTVEGEVQGDEGKLQTFFRALSIGPSHAIVTEVVQHDKDVVAGEKAFEVRH